MSHPSGGLKSNRMAGDSSEDIIEQAADQLNNANTEVGDVESNTMHTVNQRKGNPKNVHSNGHISEPMSPKRVIQDKRLLSYDEIPGWYRDNPFIRHGYRPESLSTLASFASWSYIHNETFNIFSHLIPAFVFLVSQSTVATLITRTYTRPRAGDYAIFSFFLFTAFVCFWLSSTYHTMANHSMKVSQVWLRLDFLGILFLTLGDFVSGIYLVFFCEPVLQKVYWTMIISLGAATSVLVVHPRLQGLKWRTARLSAFVGTGLTGFIPLAHGLAIHGWHWMWMGSGMPYYLLEGGLLLLGALFYSTRFPEAWAPGKFDIWGASHGIFHVLVVVATSVHLVGIWESYDWNYHHAKCRL